MQEQDYTIKITKRQNINHCSVGDFYLIFGQILNQDKTRYKKFRFVVQMYNNDICEFYEKDTYTKQDKSNYLDEIINSCLYGIKSYNNVSSFYEFCQESINNYNERGRFVEYMF